MIAFLLRNQGFAVADFRVRWLRVVFVFAVADLDDRALGLQLPFAPGFLPGVGS